MATMDYISSKNIVLLTEDLLKLIDARLVKHGLKVGYVFYRLLEKKGGYEKFELAEWATLGTLHDIGAFETENTKDFKKYELKNVRPHSIYGFLFLKNLSPFGDRAKTLLYHHIDYKKMEGLDYAYRTEAEYLAFAEAFDVYRDMLEDRFSLDLMKQHVGTRYSPEAFKHFMELEETEHISEKIDDGSFYDELDHILNYVMFTNEEKENYLRLLMYCMGFASKTKVVDSVTSIFVCDELAERLGFDKDEKEKLYYGALLHDIGMLAIPRDIIESARKLTPEEFDMMKSHVQLSEDILANRMDEECLKIAVAHHERLDGSGYPRGMYEGELNQSQKVLQVADIVTGLTGERPHKAPCTKEQTIEILRKEEKGGRISKEVTDTLILSYDEIMRKAKMESEESLTLYKKMSKQFESVKAKL
ncbi:MAG: HD domain-containing protein [Lachnospiraceae bacterium]|nr:HD domain-containing protein [Lachnospiraceae bacterium]